MRVRQYAVPAPVVASQRLRFLITHLTSLLARRLISTTVRLLPAGRATASRGLMQSSAPCSSFSAQASTAQHERGKGRGVRIFTHAAPRRRPGMLLAAPGTACYSIGMSINPMSGSHPLCGRWRCLIRHGVCVLRASNASVARHSGWHHSGGAGHAHSACAAAARTLACALPV
jgi:hypothetical protein